MEHFDVGIIGYGPIGAIAALALAKQGVSVVIIEKEKEVYKLPRAIATDNEIMRLFSQLGIQTDKEGEFVPSFSYQFCNEKLEMLFGIHRGPRDDLDYCAQSSLFRQPELEQNIRDLIRNEPLITVYLEDELRSFTQDQNFVSATTKDKKIQLKYLLGCDGAKSSVRKQLGSDLKELMAYKEPWLIVDAIINDSVTTPINLQQICDPNRAISYIPRSGTNNRRWEIQIKDEDNHEFIQTKEFIQKILHPWVNPDEFEIERTAIYTFRALEAEKWKDGRVFLLGDAAHMMPPFLGQGLSSGIRDAVNLSWKLAGVLKGTLHPTILETYELERKEHVRIITFIAILLGEILMLQGRNKVFLRNSIMKTLHQLPGTKEKIDELYFDIPKMQDYIHRAKQGNAFESIRFKNAELRHGNKIMLFDTLLNLQFGIVTFGKKIPKIPSTWMDIHAKHIHITPKKHRHTNAPPQLELVEDITGLYEVYFKELGTNGVIIRPDKYILGPLSQAEKIYRKLTSSTKYPNTADLKKPTYGTLLNQIWEEEKDQIKGPAIKLATATIISVVGLALFRKRGNFNGISTSTFSKRQ